MTPEDALKAFGFLALLEELDEEDFEYDDEGRLTSVPSEFTVEYLVASAGYDGDEWVEFSEKVFGPPNLSDDEVIDLAGDQLDRISYVSAIRSLRSASPTRKRTASV